MSKNNNGGSAFPFTPNPQPQNDDGTWSQDWEAGEEGMSLRDYFAGQALIGILASGPHSCIAEEETSDAFLYADYMLKARGESSE